MSPVRRLAAGEAPALAAIVRSLPEYFTDDVPGKVEHDAASHEAWGHGTRLLRSVLDNLAETGVSVVTVKTLDSSAGYAPYEATRAFYERNGFVYVDTIDPLPGWPPGNPAAIYAAAIR